MAIAYLNGQWLPPEEARVSVFDRGFMFGDGIYEVMAVYEGGIFLLEEHLLRLERSLAGISLPSPLSQNEWRELLKDALTRSGETNAQLYLQVTRGEAGLRSHEYPEQPDATVLLTVMPAESRPIQPCRVSTKQDYRWQRGDIKTTSLIANGMLKNEALREGFDDAILIRDGFVTEATAANVFVSKGGILVTPPESGNLLSGITRRFVLDLAGENDIPNEERPLAESELHEADEIWLSSTGQEIRPVTAVNGRPVGNGSPGVVWQKLNECFQRKKLRCLS